MTKRILSLSITIFIIFLFPLNAIAAGFDNEYMSPNSKVWDNEKVIKSIDTSDFICKTKIKTDTTCSTVYIRFDIIDYTIKTESSIKNIKLTFYISNGKSSHTIDLDKNTNNIGFSSFTATTDFNNISMCTNDNKSYARGTLIAAIKATDSEYKKPNISFSYSYYSGNNVQSIASNELIDLSVITTSKSNATISKAKSVNNDASSNKAYETTTNGNPPWTNDDKEYIEEEYEEKKSKSSNDKKEKATKFKSKSDKTTKYSTTGIAKSDTLTTASDVQGAINQSQSPKKMSTASKIGIIVSSIIALIAIALVFKGVKTLNSEQSTSSKAEQEDKNIHSNN